MIKRDEFVRELAIVSAESKYQTFAILGAMKSANIVDPKQVAEWAKFFSTGLSQSVDRGVPQPEIMIEIGRRLDDFSNDILKMCEFPMGTGRG